MTSSHELELPGLGPGPEVTTDGVSVGAFESFSFFVAQNQFVQDLRSIIISAFAFSIAHHEIVPTESHQ